MWMSVSLKPENGSFHTNLNDPQVITGLTQVLPKSGLYAHIESNLPIGRGLGSSAALSIATLRAWSQLNQSPCDFHTLYRDAFKIERIFHGNPSGVDHAVSALEGGNLSKSRSLSQTLYTTQDDIGHHGLRSAFEHLNHDRDRRTSSAPFV